MHKLLIFVKNNGHYGHHLKNVLSPKSTRSCDEITPSVFLKKLQTCMGHWYIKYDIFFKDSMRFSISKLCIGH